MKSEVEAKFLSVNFDELRQNLKRLGATCQQSMRLMKRAIIDDGKGRMQAKESYIRVRDEGDRVTLTYKQFDALSIDGAKEIETIVSSFDDTVKIFEAIGFKLLSTQESKRETWKLEGVEVVLDEWPWLNPFIEIEGNDESSIKNTAEKLGFEWNNAVFGDVMAAYRNHYPHLNMADSVVSLSHVRFGDPLPDMLKK